MKILSFEKVFNVNNNGFVYVAKAKNGDTWVRSVTGTWIKIEDESITLSNLQRDFNQFEKLGYVVKGTDIIVENSSQIINLIK